MHETGPGQPRGVLVLAGTPIGDPADASPRLARELAAADVVAAEDTRRLRRLARALAVEVSGRVVSYYDANEMSRTPELIDALRAAQSGPVSLLDTIGTTVNNTDAVWLSSLVTARMTIG